MVKELQVHRQLTCGVPELKLYAVALDYRHCYYCVWTFLGGMPPHEDKVLWWDSFWWRFVDFGVTFFLFHILKKRPQTKTTKIFMPFDMWNCLTEPLAGGVDGGDGFAILKKGPSFCKKMGLLRWTTSLESRFLAFAFGRWKNGLSEAWLKSKKSDFFLMSKSHF